MRLLRYAAEAGHARAAYKLGRVLTGPCREQERLAWLRRAIATVLRSAGLDKEAREYRDRADVEAGLDAIDKCLD